MGTGLLAPPAAPAPGPAPSAPTEPAPRPRAAWERPALAALLGVTAFLYLWSLSESGWANAYYSAAAQAASQSWKAFFFGSSDAASSITVDKAPMFLWPMGISARLFGVNSWSILVPQALEGVATVAVVYAAVRRWTGAAAGLIAGAVVAVTPVAALMFRYNNPDSMLVLLLTFGAYAAIRAIEGGATRWVVLVGVCVGLGFLAKMLQAFLVVPGFGLAYLVAAPGTLGRRIRQLLVAGVAMLVAGGWWVAAVSLWPASSRPYIGGSQDNSLLNLIFGYNGFGRLTGNEIGSVGGGPVGTSGRWGATGLYRLFNHRFGGQISWLLPTALILLVVLLVLAWRAPRTDRMRAAALLWGGWLVVTHAAIGLGQGIIHEYYTVAMAPPIGALVGIGAVELWRRRDHIAARAALAGTVAVTGWWAYRLLLRSPGWHPGLGTAVLLGGVGAAVVLMIAPVASRSLAAAIVAVAAVAAFAAPAAATWSTVLTPHSGAIPLAGPAVTAVPGRFTIPLIPIHRHPVLPGNRGPGSSFPGGPGRGPVPSGPFPSTAPQIPPPSGGILGASRPTDAVAAKLLERADDTTWVAATVSANQAAGYQLATGEPVMPIGGFNGTDPSPTLAQFQHWVAEGKIGWFIARGRTFSGQGVSLSHAGQISAWVEQNFTPTMVDGVTLYDLHVG